MLIYLSELQRDQETNLCPDYAFYGISAYLPTCTYTSLKLTLCFSHYTLTSTNMYMWKKHFQILNQSFPWIWLFNMQLCCSLSIYAKEEGIHWLKWTSEVHFFRSRREKHASIYYILTYIYYVNIYIYNTYTHITKRLTIKSSHILFF